MRLLIMIATNDCTDNRAWDLEHTVIGQQQNILF